ncbi:hypothetical protein HAHI6034_01775 [Hathewaya histolytica]|uniref:Uncharacterized protein n=1 Tax=Hathewaya histolytica TaxID=1498 RepID=A0A4U9QZM6_HATHI|nr:hypothetical protein [Hathewaya histolytica]VTQ84302.1 Uncharacterised protein [Hathewaya histolytica]
MLRCSNRISRCRCIAALPTGGTSSIVGVGIAEVAISMVMAVVAEAGAIHSQHLLGEDMENLRNAKRNKGTGKSIDIKNLVL